MMKNRIWPYQIPIILLLSILMIIYKLGENGELDKGLIKSYVYPVTETISRNFSDLKFKLRPEKEPKNKIVILGIDSHSLEAIGRWPWSRNYIAYLTESLMKYEPKVIGYDIVFSERDQRVPDELVEFLEKNGLGDSVNYFETDYIFEQSIKKYRKNLVLGWVTETNCRPAYDEVCSQLVLDEEYLSYHPENYDRFALKLFKYQDNFDFKKTPLMSVITPIPNVPLYSNAADHVGLLNITPDSDGIVRRADLFFLMNKKPYPILPLKMAMVGESKRLNVNLTDRLVDELRFEHSNVKLNLDKLGKVEINFLGDKFSFPYISALDLMSEGDEIKLMDGSDKIYSKKELLKDAYVLIGLTAVAAFDTRSFPTGENIPGVEGHATILENILSKNYLKKLGIQSEIVINLVVMIIGGIVFNYLCVHMTAVKSFFFYSFIMGFIGLIDIKLLFERNYNWENAFVFIEFNLIYFTAILIEYILEEKDKKFFKSAFGNYISPELVDIMYESGKMPELGGATRELTAYFTDIESFSTFSEKLSPQELVELLNEYLTVMTEILLDEGGMLDKYEGDAIIAFFGAPVEYEDHAQRACRVALKMQSELATLRKHWKEMGDAYPPYVREMKMRIGINTGNILSGNMGSKRRMNYTMMGDDVNLAARLEASAKFYGIYNHVADHTYDIVKDDFLFRELDTIRVVGRSTPTTTYELLDHLNGRLELVELKEKFDIALELYKEREWEKAIEQFKFCLDLENLRFPDIKTKTCPSLVYIERCNYFLSNPPEENWDGVFTLTEK